MFDDLNAQTFDIACVRKYPFLIDKQALSNTASDSTNIFL